MTLNFLRTKKLKLLNRNTKLILSVLCGIFIFQLFLKFNIQILVFAILSFLPLVFDIKFWLVTLIVFIISFLVFKLTEPPKISTSINGEYEIEDDLSIGSVIKVKGAKVLLYKKHFQIGDVVKLNGKIRDVNGKLQDYLYQKNIYYFSNKTNSNIIAHSNDFRNKIYHFLSSGSKIYEKYNPLVILGKKTKNNSDIYRMAIRENIVHLFVVSGFHFSLLFLIFNKIFSFIFKQKLIPTFISMSICLFFLYLLRFPISGTRAFLLIFAISIKKHFKIKIDNIEVLSLIMAFMFFINPRSVGSLSFIFTFLATFVLMKGSQLNISKFKKSALIFLLLWVATFPLSVYINKFFSPMGLIYSVVLTPVFTISYCLSIFLLPFKGVVDYIDIGLNFILKSFDAINPLIKINISKIFMQTFYASLLASFIIWEIWNYYTDQKNTLSI